VGLLPFELSSKIRSVTAHNLYQLKGQVPETLMTGSTADISHLCEFSWYEWVMYNDDAGYPEDTEKLGRYLGPTEPGIGSVVSFIILRPSGRVVHRTTVRKLTPQELEDKTHAKLRETFDKDIASKLGDPMTEAELGTVKGHEEDKSASRKISAVTPEYEAYEDEHEQQKRMPKVDGFDQETYDAYVLAQVQLPKGDDYQT
jgi:hypothetical protein